VDTGSVGDTLIFEEYKGTSNAELRLDRKIAGKRIYPAVDIAQFSTRKEELLLTIKEMAATRALRRALDGRDSQQANQHAPRRPPQDPHQHRVPHPAHHDYPAQRQRLGDCRPVTAPQTQSHPAPLDVALTGSGSAATER
jgi:hypothetical protein